VLRQDMSEQFRLMVERTARHRAMDAIEIGRKFQMVQNASREDLPLRRCQVDSQSGLLHLSQRIANARIRLAPEKTAFTVVLTIGGHGITDPVVAV